MMLNVRYPEDRKMKYLIYLFTLSLMLTVPFPSRATDFPDMEGWKPVSEVMTKDPEGLWEYIDGAAEQFLAYDFQLLQYRDLSMEELSVTVEIYDMAAPLNAFGMYTTERPDKSEGLSVGTEAVVLPPYQCLLLKDRYYVKVNVYEGKMTGEAGKSLLTAIAKKLPGTGTLPPELQLLPAEGKIPGSEGYTREGYLGLSELSNCLYAKYTGEKDETFQYFVIIMPPDQPIKTVWVPLTLKWKPATHAGHSILFREVPYKGKLGVIKTESGIFGATNADTEKDLLRRLAGGFLKEKEKDTGE